MTFTEIVDLVADQLSLTSPDALDRIGRRVNRRYRRVCTSIGMVTTRRKQLPFSVVAASRLQTIPCEKVLAVQIVGASRPLDAISYAEMLERMPTTGNPSCWAVKTMGASTVIIYFDASMDNGLDLTIEVEDVGSTLSGAQVPAFPESWHDILYFGALADELNKKEKAGQARDAETTYEKMLGELRLHIAVNGYQTIRQGQTDRGIGTTSSIGSSASSGASMVSHTLGALTAEALVTGNGGNDIKTGGLSGSLVATFVGQVSLNVQNLNASGTSSNTAINIGNDQSNALGTIYGLSSTFSGAAYLQPNSVVLASAGGNGLALLTTSASGPIKFFLNAVERVRFHVSGGVSIGNTTDPGAGILSVSGFGTHPFSAGGAGGNTLNVRNTTAGTGNFATISVGNDNNALLGVFSALSSTFTPSADTVASGVLFRGSGVGGLSISASDAAGAIRFYTNVFSERMRIFASGGISIGNTTDPGAAAMSFTGTLKLPSYTATTFVAGDKYLIVDANGNVHRSAIGPAS